jgi:A/G-specific adenine glycosylase
MASVARVQAALLEWYGREARDLPWRRTRDPYAILVAEVMLQQTQVERVIPKWHAWLERFPTLVDLAAATRADAIRAWQGLGYNLRAVRLHAIACQAVADFGGELPRSVEGLRRLKGIGPYTAGAIACFAYEQPVSMVDTNVRRVLSRVFVVDPDQVDALAREIIPAQAPYAWGQALMDLGATTCRAQQPRCLVCPLLGECGGPAPPRKRLQTGGAPAFAGSQRYRRGRVLDALRVLPAGASVSLQALAREHGCQPELILRMAAEGLLEVGTDQQVYLGD